MGNSKQENLKNPVPESQYRHMAMSLAGSLLQILWDAGERSAKMRMTRREGLQPWNRFVGSRMCLGIGKES
jgi:hypothetical protein